MSKLIKLPNGPYIDASSIIRISEPVEDHGSWCYTVWYGEPRSNHTVWMNATFVKSQDKAEDHLQRFVDGVNSHR